jgi:alpha-N-arabinofuranosidase
MTAVQPTNLVRERAANGRERPYNIRFLGLGNETWGCGGAMTAAHYVEEMKSYARFARNFNPAQTGANAMRRIAVGPDGQSTEYTEAVMAAWRSKVWSWDIEGISLHFYTVGGWPPHYNSVQFGERNMPRSSPTRSPSTGSSTPMCRSWIATIPRRGRPVRR